MIDSATQCNEIIVVEGVKPTGIEIGSGTYGRVFEVDYKGKLCVGKEVHKHMARSLDEETFLSFCQAWSAIRHPHIIQFLGVCYSKSVLPILVMEKMQQSLRNLVEKYVSIPWNVKLSIFNDICLGLRYLHGMNPPIVHCDLTPNNILLGGQLEAKITDLGIANYKLLRSNNRSSMNTILPFMPPEAQDENIIYTPAFDIFSFGGVILYVITQLWPELSNQIQSNDDVKKWKEMPEIMKRNYLLDKMVEEATHMKPSVISCLDVNPENRPLAEQISLVIKKAKEKFNVKCNENEKIPTVWSAQASREQESSKRQQQQQQQFNRSSNTFWDSFNQTWQQFPRIPEKCLVTSVTEMDGKVYVSALVDDPSRFASDINRKRWSPLSILSRSYYILVAVHGRKHLLAIGGSVDGPVAMSNEVSLWDEKQKQWIIRYPKMHTARCSVTAICYHSAVIVAGGITSWGPSVLTKVVEVLHINDSSLSNSHWSTVEQLPLIVYAAIPLLCNDTLYISSYIDCEDLHSNTFAVLTTSIPKLLKSNNNYSSSNNLWNKLPDPPYSSHSMICYLGHLITFTGFHLIEGQHKKMPILDKLAPMIHIFNSDTMSWDCVGYVSCGYALGRSVYIGENRILFMGGLSDMCGHVHYFSNSWIHEILQLELTPVTHRTHPSIIPY